MHGPLLKPPAPTIAALPFAPRVALDRLRAEGWRAVQLAVDKPGLRPRELTRSGRRDLAVTLRRLELDLAGLDAWIPPAHLVDPQRCDRAVAALCAAIELAADLAAAGTGRAPLSVVLPPDGADAPLAAVLERAEHLGVTVADHAVPPAPRTGVAPGIDPAAWLAAGRDPSEAFGAVGDGAVASVRVADLLTTGLRSPLGDPSGRLDLDAYRALVSIHAPLAPVVLDARQWADPWEGLRRSRTAWERAPASPR